MFQVNYVSRIKQDEVALLMAHPPDTTPTIGKNHTFSKITDTFGQTTNFLMHFFYLKCPTPIQHSPAVLILTVLAWTHLKLGEKDGYFILD